jgi:UPF0755 protein
MALVTLGALAFANRSAIRSGFDQIVGNDFQGGGYSSILFEIEPGDTGESIANSLVDQGVVKNFRTVYKLILDENPQFYPGTYQLRLHMSSRAALDALLDPSSSVTNRVLIKEGLRASVVLDVLAKATGISRSDFRTAANQREAIGLPSDAVSVEGYVFSKSNRGQHSENNDCENTRRTKSLWSQRRRPSSNSHHGFRYSSRGETRAGFL